LRWLRDQFDDFVNAFEMNDLISFQTAILERHFCSAKRFTKPKLPLVL
jgi:hypothetical protein